MECVSCLREPTGPSPTIHSRHALEHVRHSSRPQRALDIRVAIGSGQDDNASLRKLSSNGDQGGTTRVFEAKIHPGATNRADVALSRTYLGIVGPIKNRSSKTANFRDDGRL
jgi:hypothetical protein